MVVLLCLYCVLITLVYCDLFDLICVDGLVVVFVFALFCCVVLIWRFLLVLVNLTLLGCELLVNLFCGCFIICLWSGVV